MTCSYCPLNRKSISYNSDMFKKVPKELHNFFACDGMHSQGLGLQNQICPKTVWTIAYIGAKDKFALSQVDKVLEELVVGGHAELLCAMFENASYEVRSRMWKTMTSKFVDKLYLFDALFEKEELEPFSRRLLKNLHKYKHFILYEGFAVTQN